MLPYYYIIIFPHGFERERSRGGDGAPGADGAQLRGPHRGTLPEARGPPGRDRGRRKRVLPVSVQPALRGVRTSASFPQCTNGLGP